MSLMKVPVAASQAAVQFCENDFRCRIVYRRLCADDVSDDAHFDMAGSTAGIAFEIAVPICHDSNLPDCCVGVGDFVYLPTGRIRV